MDHDGPLLLINGLRISFDEAGESHPAVRGIDLGISRGETLALVGESGSGKSVTALATLGLLPRPPARIQSGEIWFDGQNLLAQKSHEVRQIRGRRMAMVFQDPLAALNPHLTAGELLMEPVQIHHRLSRRGARRRALELLKEVGLPDPESRLRAFPHQLSGGQRQRVLLAMALAGDPDLLIADEPTTALDVTVQAQVLELLRRLIKNRGMALWLITHDLGVVAGVADCIAVMYAGRIVESAPAEAFFRRPLHPYSEGLLRSVPGPDHRPGEDLPSIPGAPPPLRSLPPGCPFAPRCPHRADRCLEIEPLLDPRGDGRSVACLVDLAPAGVTGGAP